MICRELRKIWEKDATPGTLKVTSGEIELPHLYKCDWIAITDSRNHNGVYKLAQYLPDTPFYLTVDGETRAEVPDGEFEATVWRLAFPPGFERLARDIDAWLKDPKNAPSAINHESQSVIGVHSFTRTRATRDGKITGWRGAFSERISHSWRRGFNEIGGVLERLGG